MYHSQMQCKRKRQVIQRIITSSHIENFLCFFFSRNPFKVNFRDFWLKSGKVNLREKYELTEKKAVIYSFNEVKFFLIKKLLNKKVHLIRYSGLKLKKDQILILESANNCSTSVNSKIHNLKRKKMLLWTDTFRKV